MNQSITLKIQNLSVIDKSSANEWDIVKLGHGVSSKTQKLYQILQYQNQKVLKVTYPKGSYNPSNQPQGGIGFYSSPKHLFPSTDQCILQYQIYFDDKFDPVKGGKLPGLFIGKPGASGGKHFFDQASIRLMWRRSISQDQLMAQVYGYISRNQHESYYSIPKLFRNEVYGDSLWRGVLKFKKHIWNKISIRMKLNTFDGDRPNFDGILAVCINGVECLFDKLVYVDQQANIEGIMFSTFFGGSDASWATPHDTFIYFRDFKVTKIK